MHSDNKSYILHMQRDLPAAELVAWLRRAELQMEFARAFAAALPPEQTAGWAEAIQRAQMRLDGYDPATGLEGLASTVRAAETEMAAIGEVAKSHRIHCVGHGHIDMNWMWSWPETVATTHDTFASILSLMEQYPELTYSQSQTSVYALTERYFPAMFEEIRKRVGEGRWEVTAAHWVEGDKNLASGESICRHLLYSRAYFAEKFGLQPEDVPVDWEPDTFGHAITIPTILAQGAVKYYYSCRQGGGFDHVRVGDARPPLFYWQAPDGSRVLVNRESTWYNSYVNIGDNIAVPMVNFVKQTGLADWLNIYGLGNHGGGPTRTEVEYLLSLREWPIYPQVLFGTATSYFRTVEKAIADNNINLPVIDHELNFEFTGCYTSQSAIKRGNRYGENYMEEAETLAALATALTGLPYPKDRLREGWINVLFNQFHDILPGSGVRETREHAQALFQETGAITGAIKRTAGQALAARIDTLSLLPDTPFGRAERALAEQGKANTPFVAGAGIGAGLTGYSQTSGGGRRFLPFLVYNPCAWTRSERVTVALYDVNFEPGRIVARDENGINHPTMLLGKGGDWGHDKLTVAFDATDVPPLGYRTYLLCEGVPQSGEALVSAEPNDWIETPFLRIHLDRYHCGILELIDKRNGVKLSTGFLPFGEWLYVVEQPRGMTSWVLGGDANSYRDLKATSFHLHGVPRNQGTSVPLGGEALGYRVEWNLEVPGTQSTVRVSLMIHGLEPRLDFIADIDWHEIGDAKRGIPGLQVGFRVQELEREALFGLVTSLYEAPFGSVERSLSRGEEVPTLRYAYLGRRTAVEAVEEEAAEDANSSEAAVPDIVEPSAADYFSNYVADVGRQEKAYTGITLLQDSKYGHSLSGSMLRMRIVRSSFDPDHAPEVARSTVRYSLYVHDTPPTPADLTRLGAAWNHPFLLIPANLQAGDAPARHSFVQVETPNVVLSALKQAEDGSGLVLRLVELNGQDTDAVVTLAPELIAGFTSATVLDLMERPIAGNAALTGNTLHTSIPAHSFVTVRLSV